MSRALLNDPELSKFIADNFVPLAAAVEALQPSRYGGKETESSRWFVGTAKRAFEKLVMLPWTLRVLVSFTLRMITYGSQVTT